MSACSVCDKGTYTDTGGLSQCIQCSTGQYQDAVRQTTCRDCGFGRYGSSMGLTACQDCGVGQFSSWLKGYTCEKCDAGWYQNAQVAAYCTQCPSGKYQSGTGMGVCADCEAGTYQSGQGGSVCANCDTGTYQALRAQASCQACTTCLDGQLWASGCTRLGDGACTACSPGTYAVGGRVFACSVCGAGTYQDAQQGTACKACQACRAGWFQSGACTATADRQCSACPPGKFSAADGATACQTCGAGTYQDRANATACRACLTCPAGYSWGDSCNATHDAVCSRCAAGTFNPSNQTSGCARCSAGTFQDGVGATGCKACRACPANRYLLSGCDGVSDGVCATCTVCPQGTVVRACGNATDAVCGNASNCDAWGAAMGVYDWIGDAQRCQAGKFLLAYDPSGPEAATRKDCRPCPAGWAGLNGVFCERCGALEEPYYQDRSSCVCKGDAVMNASGACVCPDGYAQDQSGLCAPCGRNAYGLGGTCRACGAGTFTRGAEGATACEACEFGKYRTSSVQLECQSCALRGWYAPDAAAGDCVPCNETCATAGMQWDRWCPGDTTRGYSVCKACDGGLPDNATWANFSVDPVVAARALEECAYDCLDGFYHANGGCEACTQDRVCDAGWRLSECTNYADSNCDTACVDTNKPSFYSHWIAGANNCQWTCDDGYTLRVWDYVMFSLRECTLLA